MRRQCVTAALIMAMALGAKGGPGVRLSGYLDSDVWTDFGGNFYSNDEHDLTVGISFSDKIGIDMCVTIVGGSVPAGPGRPGAQVTSRYPFIGDTLEMTESYSRWVAVAFDGISLTYKSPVGTFTVGDLVYQYGTFNYYLYKRLSMITPERFTRGIRYSIGAEAFSQEVYAGSADTDGGGDIGGVSTIGFGKDHSLSVMYGIRGNIATSFGDGTEVYAGIGYRSEVGRNLALKADIGYVNLPGARRENVVTLLVEPAMTFGKFSTALSVYALYDPGSVNTLEDTPLFGLADEFLVYLEPGYAFTDVIGLGLPLEFHAFDMRTGDDNEFWVVPTLYVTPVEGVQWWLWGQCAVPAGGADTYYGFGTEIIVVF